MQAAFSAVVRAQVDHLQIFKRDADAVGAINVAHRAAQSAENGSPQTAHRSE